LLTDGNIIYTHKDGISEINRNKEILWTIRVPEGTEVHSAQPIGKEHVIYFLCGKPAKIVIANIKTKKTVHEIIVETNPEVYAHTQNRVARLSPWGTYVVPHLNYGKVREYNSKGDIVWEVNAPRPWCVQVLQNGNILVANEMTDTNDSVKSYQNGKVVMVKNWNLVQEFNRKGEVVWEVKYEDHPEYHGTTIQGAYRTKDGNTIMSNTTRLNRNNPHNQAVMISLDKKLLWELCSWENPDLGPSSHIQPLDEAVDRNQLFFGEFK